MEKKFLQVDGHKDLVRDTESNAIINKNKGAYLLAKQRAEAAQRQRDAIRTANRETVSLTQMTQPTTPEV